MKKYLPLFFIAVIGFCVAFQWGGQDSTENMLFRTMMQKFQEQYPTLADFTPEEIARLSTRWQGKIAQQLQVKKDNYRTLDPEKLRSLVPFFTEGNLKVFLRHGEQHMSLEVAALKEPYEKKIAMMRLPDNVQDPPTKRSLVEAFATFVGFAYLQEQYEEKFSIISSKNSRAHIPAQLLSDYFQVTLENERFLQCINYPSEEMLPTKYLMRELSSGMLPWEKESIDFIVGPNTFATILTNMRDCLESENLNPSIFITHTQQINAVQQLLGLPVGRLGYYGFIITTGTTSAVFPEGLYKSS